MRPSFLDCSIKDDEYSYLKKAKGITEITNLQTNKKGIVYYQGGIGFVIEIDGETHYDKETWKNWI